MIPTNRQIHAKLEVYRPDNTPVDVTDYLESAEVELGSIEDLGTGTGADIGVRYLSFNLRNVTDKSFAPREKTSPWNLVGSSWTPLLWPYRAVGLNVGSRVENEQLAPRVDTITVANETPTFVRWDPSVFNRQQTPTHSRNATYYRYDDQVARDDNDDVGDSELTVGNDTDSATVLINLLFGTAPTTGNLGVFTLSETPIRGSLSVSINGVPTSDFTFDYGTNELFIYDITSSSGVTASYQYVTEFLVYQLAYTPLSGTLVVRYNGSPIEDYTLNGRELTIGNDVMGTISVAYQHNVFSQTTFYTRHVNLFSGSETIHSDVEYTIDYVSGTITFTIPVPLPPRIDYEYWITLFEGYLGDNIATDPHMVSVKCRDKSKVLQDSYIDVPKTYEGPMSAEALVQAIINDYVPDVSISLHCPVPSGITFEEMKVEYVSVWDAIQNVAKQMGWFLGYRWNGTEFALIFMEPPRHKNTADFELNWVDDIYQETLDISDADIRNHITVTYRNSSGTRETITASDSSSIAEYRRRAMQIEEADTSLIDTAAKAQSFADACLWDLSQLSATNRLNLPLLPEMDLFSTMLIENPQTSSTKDFFAVQSIRHSLKFGESASFRTEIIATGRVVGAKTKWQDMETRPGRPGNPFDPDRIPPGSLPPDRLPDYSIGVDKFINQLKPPIMVTSKPNFPDPRYPVDTILFYTVDSKLYRVISGDWEPMVATDLSELEGKLQSNQIALGAITEDLLAAKAVTKTKIADGSIETPKLAAGAVVADKIASNAVTADKIASNAVTANKIEAGAVTAEKLHANAITADRIVAGILEAGGIKADWYADIRNVLPYTGQDSLDSGKPIVIPFYIPSETTNIVAAFLSAEARRYRAYSKSAPYDPGAFWDKETSGTSVFSPAVTVSLTETQTDTGNTALSHFHRYTDTHITSSVGGGHTHTINTTTYPKLYTDYTNPGTGTEHRHRHEFNSFIIPNSSGTHTHGTTNTTKDTTGPYGDSGFGSPIDLSHSHKYQRITGATLNNFASHYHEYDPAHEHQLEFGIHEDTTPSSVRIRINNGSGWSSYISLASAASGNNPYDLIAGASVPKHKGNASEMDLTSYLSGSGWKYIEFSSARLGLIAWNVILKLDITA